MASPAGRSGRASGDPFGIRSVRGLLSGFTAFIGIAVLAMLMSAAVLELQAGATAYIIGEGHWSKAQQDSVHALYRYTWTGRPQELNHAREALRVPLGDRRARLALERSPPDLDMAWHGFLQGGNAPENVERMIWMYRYFSDTPYFREAVEIWREADEGILELVDITEALAGVSPQDARMADYRSRILALDAKLRLLERAFSATLSDGSHLLQKLSLSFSGVAFLLMAGAAWMVLRLTRRRIHDSESLFRMAFHKAGVGMARIDARGRFIDVNQTLCDMLGRHRDELPGMSLADVLHPDERNTAATFGMLEEKDRQGEPAERRFLRRDGGVFWGRYTATLIHPSGKGPPSVFVLIEDVSETRRLVDEITYQASHDALTGLINRREIERLLGHLLEDAKRTGARHALCFLDLDRFKLINDTCGHVAGDHLLRQLAELLAGCLRKTDVLGRLGGDEFAILLENTALSNAQRVAEKVREVLTRFSFEWEGHRFEVTGSIGVIEITSASADIEQVLRAVDEACYDAKKKGRNRVHVHEAMV